MDSWDLAIELQLMAGLTKHYFSQGVSQKRETIPFIPPPATIP